jgi:hypothetical protein
MRLVCDGPWPAALRTASTSPREMVTVVALATTWRVDGGRLAPAAVEERWKPLSEPAVIEGAALHDDLDFRRQGVDLLVLGSVHAKGGRPVTRMEASLACGTVRHRTLVVGDRTWQKSWGKLRISEAQPFASMPITNDRAYGGVAPMKEGAMPHAMNPEGRGFRAIADSVPDAPLPNLEDPAAPIAAWTDRPLPAVWYKTAGAPPLRNPPSAPAEYATAVMHAAMRDAPPALCAERPEDLGPEILLDGFDASGPLAFPLPGDRRGWLSVQIGERRSRLEMRPIRVVVMPGPRALAVTYAARFRWLMEPRDERSVVVGWESR